MAYVVLIAMATTLESGLRSQRRVRLVVVTNVAEKLTLLVCVLTSLAVHAGLSGVAGGYVAAGVLRVALDYSFVLRGTPRGYRDSRASIMSVVRACAPFAVNAAAIVLVPRLDLPLVAVVSTTSAAYFAIGFQVFTTLAIIPVIGASTLYPFVAHHMKSVSLHRVALAFAAIGAVVTAIAIALAPLVLPVLFGNAYHRAVHITQLTLLSLPLVFYANGLLVGAYTGGQERTLLWRTLPAALVGSAAVLVGQLAYGTAGAALGFVLQYVLIVLAILSLPAAHRTPRMAAPVAAKVIRK
jgi:O-antigen/teichoic acid export membrane protein